jgi:hypothetical protein
VWPEAAVENCDRQHGAGGAVLLDAGQPLFLAGPMHAQQAQDGWIVRGHISLLWLLPISRIHLEPSKSICHIYGTEEVSMNLCRCPL